MQVPSVQILPMSHSKSATQVLEEPEDPEEEVPDPVLVEVGMGGVVAVVVAVAVGGGFGAKKHWPPLHCSSIGQSAVV
jgi:hypothetical protein